VCPASQTRRAAYVGASDFYEPGHPLLDLIEHEIGHTLDLPHSVDATGNEYGSPLDVMSDSAAPRAADPERTDAPDTIAVDRIALGWMPEAAIAVGPGRFELSASTGTTGTRVIVLPVDDRSFLTVEYLPKAGFDEHLAHGGLAMHRVSLADSCPAGAGACPGLDRKQELLNADGLVDRTSATSWSENWTVTLRADIGDGDATAEVEVHPTAG
jgi:hypothetical protein